MKLTDAEIETLLSECDADTEWVTLHVDAVKQLQRECLKARAMRDGMTYADGQFKAREGYVEHYDRAREGVTEIVEGGE